MDTKAALLKVTADEPGRLLALEGEKLALPSVAAGFLGGAALAVIGTLAAASGDSEEFWRPRRVRADLARGQLTIDDVQVIRDEERSESIALEQVEALTVRTRHFLPPRAKRPPITADHPRSLEVIVHLRDSTGAARERPLRLEILGMDSCDKVADLAFRLGAAMGLAGQRVVLSDPRRMEIEMGRQVASGLAPMPILEGPADYARGLVAPAAKRAAAEYRMPVPDPSHFPGGELRLAKWAPGDEVRADKPAQVAGLGCFLIGTLALVAGPVLWYLTHDVPSTIMLSIFGLLFGGVFLVGAFTCLPRHVRIAWARQELIVAGALSRERIPLRRLSGLVLRCVLRWQTAGNGKFEHRKYSCSLEAEVRGDTEGDTKAATLLSTQEFEDQPEAPYDALLPLTRQLAETLGIPWRVVDYD